LVVEVCRGRFWWLWWLSSVFGRGAGVWFGGLGASAVLAVVVVVVLVGVLSLGGVCVGGGG